MRTEIVTEAWEFYRDNCPGFKEPMRKQLRKVDSHMAELESQNAKLREELADAPKCDTCEAMLDCDECLRADGSHKERRRLSAENAKLRELVRAAYNCTNAGPSCLECRIVAGGCTLLSAMRELGVEVTE